MQLVGTHEEAIRGDNVILSEQKRKNNPQPMTKNSVDQGIHDTTEKFIKERLSNTLNY